ncbi:uncharacterized protein LOC135224177 [Macrobrachium nipponense]|uniref:uncharacterized protein LOC135224177 n=1 Tax=Macrobrachium nipponense TaxID=159736 RepID=UPI0030C81D21
MSGLRCFFMAIVVLSLKWNSLGLPTPSIACEGDCRSETPQSTSLGGTHSFSRGSDGTIRGVCSFNVSDTVVKITYSEDRFGNIIANAKPGTDSEEDPLAQLEQCRSAVEGAGNDLRKRLVEIRRKSG